VKEARSLESLTRITKGQRLDAKRGQWQVDNHGVNREALIKAYDVLVKTPEDRKRLEISAPLLVAARDKAVVQLKREKLAAELQRNLQNHTVRSHEELKIYRSRRFIKPTTFREVTALGVR
jgi:hypothetical protein